MFELGADPANADRTDGYNTEELEVDINAIGDKRLADFMYRPFVAACFLVDPANWVKNDSSNY